MASPKIYGNPDTEKMGSALSRLGSKKMRMRKAGPDAAKRIASAKRKYRGVKYARPTRG